MDQSLKHFYDPRKIISMDFAFILSSDNMHFNDSLAVRILFRSFRRKLFCFTNTLIWGYPFEYDNLFELSMHSPYKW